MRAVVILKYVVWKLRWLLRNIENHCVTCQQTQSGNRKGSITHKLFSLKQVRLLWAVSKSNPQKYGKVMGFFVHLPHHQSVTHWSANPKLLCYGRGEVDWTSRYSDYHNVRQRHEFCWRSEVEKARSCCFCPSRDQMETQSTQRTTPWRLLGAISWECQACIVWQQ